MNPLLCLPTTFVPPFIRKLAVRRLLRLTEEAFGSTPPSLHGLSYVDSLKAFAHFTRDEAERTLSSGNRLDEAKSVLYDRAFALGAKCRFWLKIENLRDTMAAARLLYSCCKIDLRGSMSGDVTVCKCYFSGFYSGEVCKVIGSLDAGLLAGLSGGRQLSFSQRITEGAETCKGFLAGGTQP